MLLCLETQETKNPQGNVGGIVSHRFGGLMFPAYHSMGRFGNYKPLGFNFCNVVLYRTFAWVSNVVRVWLEVFSTFGLRPHGKRRVGHVANISQCHIIVSITKYATSGKVKRGRGLELSHLYRATAYRIEIVSEVFVF